VVIKYLVSDPTASGTPTGTVTISDGVDTCSATAAAGQCSLTFSTLGLKTLTATYSGDVAYEPSVGTDGHRVKADTSVTITSTVRSSSVSGETVVVHYSVAVTTPGTGTPTGNVTVSDGTLSCSAPQAAGQCSITFPTAGTRSLTAVYAGDDDYNTSTSASFTHAVAPAATTLVITSHSPDPSIVGAPVTTTWSLNVNSPGAGAPTGLMTITDGVNSCSAPVADGGCTITLTTLGARTLVATYAGDANFSTATTAVGHAVRGNTTTTISATAPASSVTGQTVTVSWTVGLVSPATGSPTGTVAVQSTAGSCNAPVSSGSCTIPFAAAGTYNLVATYSGDDIYNTSTSSAFSHIVTQASTTTTIVSADPNPSVIAASVPVFFTVVPGAPGAGTPSGTVTISAGADTCSATVAEGTCTIVFSHAGSQALTAVYSGDSNYLTSTSSPFAHDVTRAITSLEVTSHSPNPSLVGAPLTVNWALTVVTPGAGTATGLVTISDGVNSCSAPVATQTCNITLMTLGSRTLTASYAGDSDFSPTSTSATHTVTSNTSSVITGTSPAASVTGQTVAISWTVLPVAPGTGTPTGTVTISDGTTSCNAAVGAGTCSLAFPTAGGHALTATYSGDAIYNGSVSSSANHNVGVASTTTSIASAEPNPSQINVAFPVLFSVTPNNPGAGLPTGIVTVSDGTDSCFASVATGQCSLTSSTVGARTLVATYSGDSNFAGSASSGTAHRVRGGSTLTIVTTPASSVAGQSVLVTATASAAAPATGTPSGSVTVTDGTVSCTITLAGGIGTCPLAFATAGTRTLTAAYTGDVTYDSSGTTLVHGVDRAATTASIVSRTPPTSVSGQVVTIAFGVSVSSPGAGTPTGVVTVSDGTQSCSASVAAGQCDIAFVTSGAHALTASYAGDANFLPATSGFVTHNVDKAATSISIASHDASPSVSGQAITVVFNATPTAPGAGVLTGNVTVTASTGETCNGSVIGGQCSMTFATAASRTLTAAYGGDANFNASTSAAATHVVDKASSVVAITTTNPSPSVPGEPIVISWNIGVSAPGSSPITGTVSITDGVVTCSAPVGDGHCTMAIPSAGSKSLVATYSGDTNLNGATSNAATHVVQRGSTVTTITSHTPDPSNTLAPVVVSFAVAVSAPASGTATGNVTVSDGTTSCTAPLSVGSCSLRLGIPVATHTLTASYAGDVNFAPSTSAGVPHAVINGAPSTANDAYTADEGSLLKVSAPGVLANDSDADGPVAMTAVLLSTTSKGVLDLQTSGAFTYFPQANFSGRDSFTYQACDSIVCAGPVTVTIDVQPSVIPTARLGGSETICRGGEATLTVLIRGALPVTLTWSDGHVQTAASLTATRVVQPVSTTIYSVTKVANADGSGPGTGSRTINVTVVAPPSISAASPIVLGAQLTLSATAGYDTYQWFHDDVPIAEVTSSLLNFKGLTALDLGLYSVTGTRDGCTSPRSASLDVRVEEEEDIIAVIGATHGAGGAEFRTVLQVTNATDQAMSGFIDWSPLGEHNASAINRYPYSLSPGQTRYVDDLFPQGFSGLATGSIHRLNGALPLGLAHVYNDMGEGGTTGMLQTAISESAALRKGDQAVLITPFDPAATRFNVGMRALRDGLQMRITHRDSEGKLIGSVDHVIGASDLSQIPASSLLGHPIGGGDSITFEVLSGGGIIYGAATDNRTNDPNMQMASRITPRLGEGTSIIAVAGSVAGVFGSRFATELQIHNPGTEPMSIDLAFHPAGASARNEDPHLQVTVEALATVTMPDVVATLQTEGLGSMNLVATGSVQPLSVVRIYSISDAGQTSMTEDVIPVESALRSGETGVILAPHDPKSTRFNIGIRTIEATRMTATVRSANGAVARTITLAYPANYFVQSTAAGLLDGEIGADQSIAFRIEEGSAVIYGVRTDNRTQDPSAQFALRP
jgi:large repetitive protein